MLQLVLGRAGTGKSTYVMDALCRTASAGDRAILLVPEQFSFESERAAFRRLGPKAMGNIEVLSFTRLANLIFRQYGGLAGRRLDEPTRLVLMSAALDEVADELTLYRDAARNSSFLELLLDVTAQFKNAGTGPERLAGTAEDLEDEGLSRKLRELSLIYAAFQALVERSYSDPLDDISRGAALAAEHGFFAGYIVYIDAFMSFTPAEHSMLDAILADSPLVTAAFCADAGSFSMGEESGLFASSVKAARRLTRAALRQGAQVEPPVWMDKPVRFERPGIASVEGLLSGHPPAALETGGLELVEAGLPYDEVEYAAARISALVREEGMRYRDMAVIARDTERYGSDIEGVFGRYGIPFFVDAAVDIELHPVVLALLASLEAVRGSYDTDEILRLAKSPVFGIEPQAAAELENYCYVWSVQGEGWTAEFQNNPRGIQGAMAPGERELLERVNGVRSRLMGPLEQLREDLRGCNGRQFAFAAYRFLERAGCAGHMREFCRALSGPQAKQELELAEAIWDSVMELLDMFAAVLGKARYPLGKFIDLLRMTIASLEVGRIPLTLDQVMVGSADRIRPGEIKAAFVLGVNEGIFPPVVRPGGVFSERERLRLAEAGIELGQPAMLRALEERFFLYRALCSPSRHLAVSFARAGARGEALAASMPLEGLRKALPAAVKRAGDLPLGQRVVNAATAAEELARRWSSPDSHTGSLAEYLRQAGEGGAVERLEAMGRFGAAGGITRASAGRLFGREITLSATRLEEFYRCPFRYYCRYGLGVQPLKRAEFSPLESGTAIHYVLERMVAKYGGKALAHLDETELHREVVGCIEAFLAGAVAEQDALPARTKYLFNRLVSVLVRILQRLGAEFAQSLFEPAGMEVKVGEGCEVLPLRVAAGEGVTVTVQGSIDRVDLLCRGQAQFARVVDYKSGGKKFRLSDVYYGLNMQMLVYLFALCEGGQGRYANSLPAGILYMPAKAEAVDLPRQADGGELAKKQGAALRMNGLLLGDEEILTAMERALAGEYIPAKRTQTGYDRYSSLASPGELEKIKGHVKKIIGEMGLRLTRGQVAPSPAVQSGYDPCEACDYTALCHRQRLDAARELKSFSDADFYALLDREEGKGETL